MATPQENERLAIALHEALPASAIQNLCSHIANSIEQEWKIPVSMREIDFALWEWVRLSRIAANRVKGPRD